MNPQDQKAHTKVTDILAHRQETLEKSAADALDAAAQSIKSVAEVAKELVDSERYDRLMMKMELEDALRDSTEAMLKILYRFTHLPLLGRIRWVLTGKL